MILTNNGKAFLYATTYVSNDSAISAGGQVIVRRSDDASDLILYKGAGTHATYGVNNQSYQAHLNGLHISVGSGTTAPSITDIALNNEIVNSSFVRINQSSRNRDNRTGTYQVPVILTASCTFENTSQSDIFTVNEIGLCTYPVEGGQPIPTDFSNYPAYSILLAREVLSNPIPIGPGETATFSITIA